MAPPLVVLAASSEQLVEKHLVVAMPFAAFVVVPFVLLVFGHEQPTASTH